MDLGQLKIGIFVMKLVWPESRCFRPTTARVWGAENFGKFGLARQNGQNCLVVAQPKLALARLLIRSIQLHVNRRKCGALYKSL